MAKKKQVDPPPKRRGRPPKESTPQRVDSQEPKRRGAKRIYDHDKILSVLQKHQGDVGGLEAAYNELIKLKQYKDISKGYVSVLAQRNGIRFGLGRIPTKQNRRR